jgi:adducin
MIKIDNPNQFVPIGTNSKEVKAKVKEIRKEYYDEKITAGPQSRILEGMTWEEAQRIREGNVASDTIILVGAASRGIIQRDHQSSATVFKTYYAPNPFDNVTEEDVEEYKAEIHKKTRRTTTGDALTTEDESDAIIPGPDGRLISTEERMQHIRMVQPESPVPEPSPVPVNKGTLETDVDAMDLMAGGEPQPAPIPKAQAPPKPERAQPEPAAVSSPAKSTSSGEATVEDRSGTDVGSPVREASKKAESSTPTPAADEKEKKKKKKGGFRMPSFSSKKKEK